MTDLSLRIFRVRIREDGKRIGRPPLPRAVRLWSKIERRGKNECWPWIAALTIYGYGKFGMKWNGRHQEMNAHRALWLLKYGDIDSGLEVAHKCDNRLCCNPSHLFLATQRENQLDMIRKGRHGIGEQSGMAKLTELKVIEIRTRYADGGETFRSLAKEYGVTKTQIGNVIRKISWSHIV